MGGTPVHHPFRDDFSVMKHTFGVPPCMETPKWGRLETATKNESSPVSSWLMPDAFRKKSGKAGQGPTIPDK